MKTNSLRALSAGTSDPFDRHFSLCLKARLELLEKDLRVAVVKVVVVVVV
jgi:hypothetical protein